jgi:alkanesulfonate monooxygenase SsuD/methylene tetrahydromethanopterin reductase-like flavin-dependent oxidoreductase (luciferase family)
MRTHAPESVWVNDRSKARCIIVFIGANFCTYASTFMPPFFIARSLNSLDLITDGRMAFNVITSTRRSDAANYGFDELMEHNSRYDRMEEFVDTSKALWASVEPDAFVWDRATGMVCDPAKVHPINHVGQCFRFAVRSTPYPRRRGGRC